MAGTTARSGLTLGMVAFAFVAAGCPKGPPVKAAYRGNGAPAEPPPAERKAPSPPGPENPERVRRMHESFGIVQRIHDALVQADLVGAQAQAEALERGVTAREVPVGWETHVEALANTAQAVNRSAALDEASIGVSQLVTACGDCHRAQRVNVVLPDPAPPEDSPMELHAWGVRRMWEGLMIPSDDRFLRGTTMFAVLPRCEDVAAPKPEFQAKCQRAKDLAKRGHVAPTAEARTKLYGQLLSTCSDCHASSTAG